MERRAEPRRFRRIFFSFTWGARDADHGGRRELSLRFARSIPGATASWTSFCAVSEAPEEDVLHCASAGGFSRASTRQSCRAQAEWRYDRISLRTEFG